MQSRVTASSHLSGVGDMIMYCVTKRSLWLVLLLYNYPVKSHDAFQELRKTPFHLLQLKPYCLSLWGGKGSFWLSAEMDFLAFLFFFSDIRLHYLCIKKPSKGLYERRRDGTAQRILQGTMLILIQNYSEEMSLIQLTMSSKAKNQCLLLTKTFTLRQAPSNLQVLLLENHVFLERSLPELQKLWLIFSYKWHPIVLSIPWSTSTTKWAGETDKQLFFYTTCSWMCFLRVVTTNNHKASALVNNHVQFFIS